MKMQQVTYYAEISILVDGWPWNLSEFDFRRWFAPGATPPALWPADFVGESRMAPPAARVSGNRRVGERRHQRDRRRKAA